MVSAPTPAPIRVGVPLSHHIRRGGYHPPTPYAETDATAPPHTQRRMPQHRHIRRGGYHPPAPYAETDATASPHTQGRVPSTHTIRWIRNSKNSTCKGALIDMMEWFDKFRKVVNPAHKTGIAGKPRRSLHQERSGDMPPVHGCDTPHVHGCDTPHVHGSDTPPGHGNGVLHVHGSGVLSEHGSDTPHMHGSGSSLEYGSGALQEHSGGALQEHNGGTLPERNGDMPLVHGCDTMLGHGNSALPPSVDGFDASAKLRAVVKLAPREKEVFARCLEGAKMKDIAAELGIKTSTVNGYCREIYRKLEVNSKVQLVLLYSDLKNHDLHNYNRKPPESVVARSAVAIQSRK